MKRFFLAIAFCSSLLIGLSFFLFPVADAAENPIAILLNLPAPPPPNPAVTVESNDRPEDFFHKSRPPADDAPIADLIAYWSQQSDEYRELGYNPAPSPKVLDRLLSAVEEKPDRVYELLNVFRDSPKAAELVKRIYDRAPPEDDPDRERRARLKAWLTYNSPYFSAQLVSKAAKVADVGEYVSNQTELLALGRVDWDRARPIVDRLYAGSGRVSRVLAQWALYRNALDSNSLSDIERYRGELKAVVEDKTATDGMRDLAFDALVKEKGWDGRDEWYYSLLSDETLAELKVDGSTYTGLTTIMYYSADEQYVDKMLELLRSDNKTVRTAAARNLFHRIPTNNPEIVRGLLPWLADPKWLNIDSDGRGQIVSALQSVKVLESVPALIAALDERTQVESLPSNSNANAAVRRMMEAANAAGRAANAAAAAANAMNTAANYAAAYGRFYSPGDQYPLRQAAIAALSNQEDPRAVPALKRILNEKSEPVLAHPLVVAIYNCEGYSIAEQVDALEEVAQRADMIEDKGNTNASFMPANLMAVPLAFRSGSDSTLILGNHLAELTEVKDELAAGVVERIISLDKSDPKAALALRRVVMRWNSAAVYTLLLRDLKNQKADSETIVKLLTVRQKLRETQQSDIYDIRTGSQTAIGISACILEDPTDLETILDSGTDEARTAMLACARLIRAPLSVQKVARYIQSKDKLLALAAERYLESEDSAEARRIVLALHPNEAKIMGATTAFRIADGPASPEDKNVQELFATVSAFHKRLEGPAGESYGYFESDIGDMEKVAKEDVLKNPDLRTVYNWQNNFIHVYKDGAVFSWRDDPARYRERTLSKEEFERFENLILESKSDEMPPYLECIECEARQLLVLGRNGGRRVYVRSDSLPPFFATLDEMIADFRREPASVKYWAARDVPGLELLFADDRYAATTVWKSGSDFRLLVANEERRSEIQKELENYADSARENDDEDPEIAGLKIEIEQLKREYESLAWFDFSEGSLGPQKPQPAEVPYIPVKDQLEVESAQGQWKARVGAVEIRANESGLYKVVAGKLTKIKTGFYTDPVITPNGRWVIVTKYSDQGVGVVRINLLTNREYRLDRDNLPAFRAVAYVESVGRILVGPPDLTGEDYYPSKAFGGGQEIDGDSISRLYAFVDPETGAMIPASGEVRPLIQQKIRPLQPATSRFEFWAAIPKGTGTAVGVYDSRTLTFRLVLMLPTITFDSMDMWVDAVEGRLYFVYGGHLLAAPVKVGR